MCFISRKIPENIPEMTNFKLLYFQKYVTNFQKINCSEFLKTYILILIRSDSQQSSFKKHPDHPKCSNRGYILFYSSLARPNNDHCDCETNSL